MRNLTPKLPEGHPKFPTFSNSITVEYDPEGVRGRYCVASRDIEAGELLAVETPFVWLLDKESCRAHCWHCFRPLLAPVPCPQCAGTYLLVTYVHISVEVAFVYFRCFRLDEERFVILIIFKKILTIRINYHSAL